MPSVHAGLSGSLTLAEVFFGNLAVVASFMLFCLSQRDHVRPLRTLGVNQDNHLAGQKAKADLTRLAIVLSFVFTRNGEVVPYCIASGEVERLTRTRLERWFAVCGWEPTPAASTPCAVSVVSSAFPFRRGTHRHRSHRPVLADPSTAVPELIRGTAMVAATSGDVSHFKDARHFARLTDFTNFTSVRLAGGRSIGRLRRVRVRRQVSAHPCAASSSRTILRTSS